jgi:Resolvase, N terminal domain
MAESISLKPCPSHLSKWPPNALPIQSKLKRVFGQRQEPAKMFRVGLYARVSTHDQQTLPLQIRTMREYAMKRGWTVAAQIREVGSGAAERELRERLLAAAAGARSMSYWSGDWIAGAGHSPIWS